MEHNDIPCSGGPQDLPLSHAVDAAMDFSRAIWRLAFEEHVGGLKDESLVFQLEAFDAWKQQYLASRHEKEASAFCWILRRLSILQWLKRDQEQRTIHLNLDVLRPTKFVEALLPFGRHADKDYFMRRNIRRTYRYELTADTVHVFNLLAATANRQVRTRATGSHDSLTREKLRQRRQPEVSSRRILDYKAELSQPILDACVQDIITRSSEQRHRCVFLESCRLAGFIGPHPTRAGAVTVLAEEFDAQYLLSRLFGLPTEMVGLDNLFGGGGPALAERSEPGGQGPSGRIILVRGRFGTGKSSFALGIAAEVARKEGLAWIMPEQTSQDCRFYLESLNALSGSGAVEIIDDLAGLRQLLEAASAESTARQGTTTAHGVIVLLELDKSTLESVLDETTQKAELSASYPLRLFVVDPVNSLLGWEALEGDAAALRERLLKLFERIKRSGANLLLIAEDKEEPASASDKHPARFLENIADCVIDLSVKAQHGYSQRYVEVLKSRFQRDQRGKHPFSIQAGQGLAVRPSSASVLARIQNRRFKKLDRPTSYGWSELDEVLGRNAIFPGDSLVLRGAEGSFKTHIGLLFLLGHDPGRKPAVGRVRRSLVLPVHDNPQNVLRLLNSPYITHHRSRQEACKGYAQITLVPLPLGFVSPGAVFQALEFEFEKANLAGDVIDRVMIDDVSHWEISCPFIREDETFGDTLIEFLRRHEATSLFVCSPKGGYDGSVLQSSLIDGADCLIDFSRIEFRGAQRVMLRVVKSRDMRHKPESFDVILSDDGLSLGPASKLLRVSASGEANPVLTRLYLHQEHAAHAAYNANIEDSLRPVLSRTVKVNSKDRTHLVRSLKLSPYSSVDELQIVQLDEFQLPELAAGFPKNLLHNFRCSDWDDHNWGDISPRLTKQVWCDDNRQEDDREFLMHARQSTLNPDNTHVADGPRKWFCAVPYYDNVGLLAYRSEFLDLQKAGSWREIALECKNWEQSPAGGQRSPREVFFYFATNIDENYNCMFFEILLSLECRPKQVSGDGTKGKGFCRLREWLRDPLVLTACETMRLLCRRVHGLASSFSLELSARQPKCGILRGANDRAEPDSDERASCEGESQIALTCIELQKTARVWRHWFTTLSEMLSKLTCEERAGIMAVPLPGGKSVAGEWYLAVPAYSAAPDIGLEVIRILTTREEELERLRRGVGLPTRTEYYEKGYADMPNAGCLTLSAAELGELLKESFRRSELECYPMATRVLTFHLKRIIEIPGESEDTVRNHIRMQLENLDRDIEFVHRGYHG
jgi:KaiC/GvpD/RAD55 family RecA-like ATPase